MPRGYYQPRRRYSPAANLVAPGFTASMTVPSVAGVMVTPQTALTFSAYFACIKVICEDLSSLPLVEFQCRPGGGCEARPFSPISRLFGFSADNECPALNWREAWLSHCLSWGNGYAEIDWSDQGQPLGLYLIHPSVIMPKRDQETGRLYYSLQTAESIAAPRPNRAIPPWKILHLAGIGFNGLAGYSVVALHREAIGSGKSMEQFEAAFYGNGAWPGAVIELARSMKPEAIKNLRESFNLVHQGSGAAFKIAILEEGHKWNQISMPLRDAEFIASRKFQVLEMCRIFRVPPHKLQDFEQSHDANMEASNEDYILSCLRPWAQRMEGCINFKLIGWDGYQAGRYVKHDFRPLWLRTAKDKADWYQRMFQLGYYTVDEMKALEGENPIGDAAGGSKRFVMGQLVDLTLAGDPAHASQVKHPDGAPGRPERFSLNGVH
jgi:HK97 family phage portal protein